MPSGRSKKAAAERRARAFALVRLCVIGIALLLVVALVIWELESEDDGSALSARILPTRDLRATAEALNDAVDASLVRLGIGSVQSVREDKEDEARLWTRWEKTGRIPHGVGTFYCNAKMVQAARSAGGELIRAKELGPDWRGLKTLDMRLGLGGVETHRIVLKESERSSREDAVARAGEHPKLAILIDDFGYSNDALVEDFLSLDFPVSISVLPGTPHAATVAEKAAARGLDVLVHIPMEPDGYPDIDPGEGALLLEHSHWEIRQLVNAAIEALPDAIGASNHMGSAFSRDAARMSTVMAAVSDHGFMYVDSMTTPDSKGFSAAVRAGVPTVRNSMFIDSLLDEEGRIDVHTQLVALEEIARKRGFGVGIGHPHPETLEALRAEVPQLLERGFQLVSISDLAH